MAILCFEAQIDQYLMWWATVGDCEKLRAVRIKPSSVGNDRCGHE